MYYYRRFLDYAEMRRTSEHAYIQSINHLSSTLYLLNFKYYLDISNNSYRETEE